jgi:hypothetical protein
MVSCIDNNKRTIEDWQAGLKSEHPKIKNILLQADNGFFLSFNKVDDHSYAFFFMNSNEHKIHKSIETWLETYLNERKVILDAGYTIKGGITFKQTENFDRLHFIYRVGGNESLIFSFFLVDGKWQYSGVS